MCQIFQFTHLTILRQMLLDAKMAQYTPKMVGVSGPQTGAVNIGLRVYGTGERGREVREEM